MSDPHQPHTATAPPPGEPSGKPTRATEAAATDMNETAEADRPDEKLVPVSESIRYRRRAQSAEQKLAGLEAELHEARGQLDAAREQITLAERRRQIDQGLIEADAIDLEAARLLTEAAIEQMDDAEVSEVIDDLRRHKPYLFRRREGRGHGSLSPRVRQGAGHAADEAAAAAAASGDRRDLLRYLRIRRAGAR